MGQRWGGINRDHSQRPQRNDEVSELSKVIIGPGNVNGGLQSKPYDVKSNNSEIHRFCNDVIRAVVLTEAKYWPHWYMGMHNIHHGCEREISNV